MPKPSRKQTDQSYYALPPGDNTKYTSYLTEIASRPKVDLKDSNAVGERIRDYFELCAKWDMRPSVSGLALALGVDRGHLTKIRIGAIGQTYPQSAKYIQDAYRLLEAMWEAYMLDSKINPANGIFLAKNHFGYRDVQDVEITPKQPLGELADPGEIRKRLEGAKDIEE